MEGEERRRDCHRRSRSRPGRVVLHFVRSSRPLPTSILTGLMDRKLKYQFQLQYRGIRIQSHQNIEFVFSEGDVHTDGTVKDY